MSYLNKKTSWEEAIREAEDRVCGVYAIPVDTIRKKNRSRESSQARFAVWYILNDVLRMTFGEIAKEYNVHHTTVIHGIKRAAELGMPTELGISSGKRVGQRKV